MCAQAVAFLPALIATDAPGCALEPSGGSRDIRLAYRAGSEANPALAAARGAIRAQPPG